VWFGTSSGRLVRFDPATARDRTRTGLDSIDAIAFGHGSVWTADTLGGTVTRYDPETMRAEATIDVAAGLDYLVSGDAAVWALSRRLGSLTQIDVAENVAARTVQVGEVPTGLTTGLGAVWVGDKDGVIRRVDEDTRQVTEIPFGTEIRAIAFDEDTDTHWIDVA
jgi:streptogramin lyase